MKSNDTESTILFETIKRPVTTDNVYRNGFIVHDRIRWIRHKGIAL